MNEATRPIRLARTRRPLGVTLAEMIVAVAILAGMFVLIGRIFSASGKSSSIAIGTANANRALRLLIRTMREDLRHIDLANGYLVIRKVQLVHENDDTKGRFYLTPDEKAQYAALAAPGNLPPTPLQSDMLIFFTNRRTNSYTELGAVLGQSVIDDGVQDSNEVWHQASTSQLAQVVYGHANFVEYDSVGQLVQVWEGGDSDTVFDIEDTDQAAVQPTGEIFGSSLRLSRRAVLMGEFDKVWGPLYDQRIVGATDDRVPRMPWTEFLPIGMPFSLPLPAVDLANVARSDFRSLVDPYPPANQVHRLAYDFLPGCVEFDIAWTYKSREFDEYLEWVNAAYPDYQYGYPLTMKARPKVSDEPIATSAPQRWYHNLTRGSVTNEELAVRDPFLWNRNYRFRDLWYVASNPNEQVAYWPVPAPVSPTTFVEIRPSALRIRVRLFDPQGGLTEPIESTFIVPVGAEG